jgi:hypothetical protein
VPALARFEACEALHVPYLIDADLGSAIEADYLHIGMLSGGDPEALAALAAWLFVRQAV